MSQEPALDDVRQARRDLERLTTQIQQVPGYEDFLAAPTFDDVAEAAGVDPVVYLAATDAGGLGLIVRGDAVTHVPLPALTTQALRSHVADHFAVYAHYINDPKAHRRRWLESLDDITRWLWAAAMGTVSDALGTPSAVTVVAGGLLGLLPLHAAWTPDDAAPTGRRYALDLAPMSFIPNARSLSVARRRATVTPKRLLALAEPWPVAASRLPSAEQEALAAAASFGPQARILRGGSATSMSFQHAVKDADVLHLACHGFARLDSPLDSGLLLADGPLTLRQLLGLDLQLRLVVLSACETAMPGTELPDEVISLPTGLLQAGVAGVVASQWSVPDRATALLMAQFYRVWETGRATPGEALRIAQRWQRDTTNQEKIDCLTTALGECEAWLPTSLGRDLLDGLYYRDPDARDHADLHSWAAFAHVGA